MVALALIELGLKYEDAVELIREWVTFSKLPFSSCIRFAGCMIFILVAGNVVGL